MQYTCITHLYLGGWDIPSATHSMHPLFMYVGYYLSFHTTPTALCNGDAVRKHSTCIIIHCPITQVQMLLYVKIHWHFSCFNTYHPDTDSFKSNLTLLLEAGFSAGVKLILKNETLSNLVLLQH